MFFHREALQGGATLMITQAFCYLPSYTGQLLPRAFWQELICVIRCLHKVPSVDVLITHMNCLGINFPTTRTFVTQKNCFRIISVIISGLIVIVYHSLQNHYTHEIIIFELFRRLRFILFFFWGGGLRINFHYSYSFLIFLQGYSYRK